jgi:hypothetical protein
MEMKAWVQFCRNVLGMEQFYSEPLRMNTQVNAMASCGKRDE